MRFIISTVLVLLSVSGFSQQYYLFVGTYTEGAAAEGSKAEKLDVFRRVRDQIEEHIHKFIAQES